jgi:hypothetical protein
VASNPALMKINDAKKAVMFIKILIYLFVVDDTKDDRKST